MAAVWKTPRTLRLERDHADMLQLRKDSTILDFKGDGDPPEKYRIIFHGKSLVPGGKGGAKLGDRQELEIRLGIEYPRSRPDVHWTTPVLHPNIFHSSVCFGNFGSQWTPYFRLADFVEVMWDYARLAILNPRSAGPSAANEEAEWAELDRKFVFPVDKRPLRDRVLGPDAGSSVVRQTPSDRNDIVIMDDDEGGMCT